MGTSMYYGGVTCNISHQSRLMHCGKPTLSTVKVTFFCKSADERIVDSTVSLQANTCHSSYEPLSNVHIALLRGSPDQKAIRGGADLEPSRLQDIEPMLHLIEATLMRQGIHQGTKTRGINFDITLQHLLQPSFSPHQVI